MGVPSVAPGEGSLALCPSPPGRSLTGWTFPTLQPRWLGTGAFLPLACPIHRVGLASCDYALNPACGGFRLWLAQRDPEVPHSLSQELCFGVCQCSGTFGRRVELGAVNPLLLGRSSGDLEESWSWLCYLWPKPEVSSTAEPFLPRPESDRQRSGDSC